MKTADDQKRKGHTMILRAALGLVVGGVLGFALYRFVGCSTGACPITSNPWVSTIFGMVMGLMLTASA